MKLNRLGAFTLGVVITAVSVGAVSFVNAAGDATLKACANKTNGAMRYISKGACKKTETSLLWNQMGPQGLPGSSGSAGAKGETGTAGTDGAAGTNGTSGASANSQIKNICGDNGTTACAIGLKGPGGGIVFMTPSTPGNTSGLFYEAAPSTWHSPSGDPESAWCDNALALLGIGSETPMAAGAIDGPAKSTLMLSECTSGAANLADAYVVTVNGVVYGDWFLPSKGELNQLHLNSQLPFLRYWSSSEAHQTAAWAQRVDQSPGIYSKSQLWYVRPVRAF